MRKIIFGFILLFIHQHSIISQQNMLLNKIIANANSQTIRSIDGFNESFLRLSENGQANDAMLFQLYFEGIIPDSTISNYIKSQNNDGSWSDIHYSDKRRSGWGPMTHCTRIRALTRAYFSKDNRYFKSSILFETIVKAIQFWCNAKLVCPNWWYNEVGCPKTLSPAILLLKDELPVTTLNGIVKYLENSTLTKTGQNKVWLAGNVLYKSLILGDVKIVKQARDSIFSEIAVTLKEGLQPDYSFHQHGPQMQFGNYGLAYINSVASLACLFAGTELELEHSKVEVLSKYALEGIQWTIWKGRMDMNACGRQISQNSSTGKAHSLATTFIDLLF